MPCTGLMEKMARCKISLICIRLPYTGSEAVPSALAMNKDMAKAVYKRAGIPHTGI